MQKNDPRYTAYVAVLRRHLRPAMGCTEPIAIAYASAVCRCALGCLPETVEVQVSGNILKNAKSVTVPNTNGKKGIDAACAAGIIAGDAQKELEVIASVTDAQRAELDRYLQEKHITVGLMPEARVFDIRVIASCNGHTAVTRIADRHTNVVQVELDGCVQQSCTLNEEKSIADPDEELLTIEGIFDFARTCDTADVAEVLERQIDYNTAIAREGISGCWGAAVGRVLLDSFGDSNVRVRARAYAAAGSDARMAGCELPVIINSGSGNQGITVSLPVIEYAKELNASHDQLLRALALSNLAAIRVKALIGYLSAFCGAISAGCAAGAGIAFLSGGDLYVINHTLVNSLAVLSGTICDGAKPSCAAKIASAVDAGIMGYQLALAGKQFRDGEGIIKKGVENTIRNIGRLGKEGMRNTDTEILHMMTE